MGPGPGANNDYLLNDMAELTPSELLELENEGLLQETADVRAAVAQLEAQVKAAKQYLVKLDTEVKRRAMSIAAR